MRKLKYKSKRCPRCQTKNDYTQARCTECGLIFSRVENGSNRIAKNLLLGGKKEDVLLAPGYPKDVSKKKFLLLCGFLGLFGVHNFYVGRYKKAVFQLIMGMLTIILFVFSGILANIDTIMSFFSVPIGISVMIICFDFIDGIFNKYKIPIAVDL